MGRPSLVHTMDVADAAASVRLRLGPLGVTIILENASTRSVNGIAFYPEAYAWLRSEAALFVLQNGRNTPVGTLTFRGTTFAGLPLKVSPDEKHWAKLLLLAATGRAEVVQL